MFASATEDQIVAELVAGLRCRIAPAPRASRALPLVEQPQAFVGVRSRFVGEVVGAARERVDRRDVRPHGRRQQTEATGKFS